MECPKCQKELEKDEKLSEEKGRDIYKLFVIGDDPVQYCDKCVRELNKTK